MCNVLLFYFVSDSTGSKFNAESSLHPGGQAGVNARKGEDDTGEARRESHQETRVSGEQVKFMELVT